MLRAPLYDPKNVFMHDAVLPSCRQHPKKGAGQYSGGRRLTCAEFGETVEALAPGWSRMLYIY
jgi:hypothetical protein